MAHEDRILGATIAGKYKVRRVVGGGSMGIVCEAEHIDIGKRVAIKLIEASLAGMNEIVLRFRQEARAASLIESHHIVQVFDVGTDEHLGLYLVMEYLVGEDLAKRLARDKRLPVDAALRIAVQVARGLAKAHEVGVVHRDLKPANIFLCASEDDEPLAKILDFGISKLAVRRPDAPPALKLTRDGMVVGTPQYMSPEQAQGFPVDERTDIWALGLVLYEMLAGRAAYQELPSYERFIIRLVSEPPDALSRVAPWVSAELASVVHAALEHDLEKRIPSCAELVRRLIEAHPIQSSKIGVRPVERSAPTELEASDTMVMTERPEHRPAPRAPPAATDGTGLSSSGVRGSVRPSPPEDFEPDGPQFFDRKQLRTLDVAVASAAPPAPLSAVPSSLTPYTGTAGAPPPLDESAPRGAPLATAPAASHATRRLGLPLAGVVLVVVGLLVAAAWALR